MTDKRMVAAGAVAVVAVGILIASQLGHAGGPVAASSAPVGGGIIVPISSTPSANSSGSATASPSPTVSSTIIRDTERISLPGIAYVTALHGLDYTIGYPGWKPSSFDGILTGDLLATQTQRSAVVAAGPATAGDQTTWDNLVATRTVTQTAIEKSVLAPKTGGGWLVQINWHSLTRSNGVQSRSGSIFTVITVVDVNGVYLASSDVMPQAP